MRDTEFREFVETRILKVMTARMTRSQIQPIVDEIVERWRQDQRDSFRIGYQFAKAAAGGSK